MDITKVRCSVYTHVSDEVISTTVI